MSVHTRLKSFYTCPDAVIIRGDPSFKDYEFDTVIHSSILFDILPASTEGYGRTIKLDFHKNIRTLIQHMLIDLRKILIEVFPRQADSSWTSVVYTNPEDEWLFETISYKGIVKNLYTGVVIKKTNPLNKSAHLPTCQQLRPGLNLMLRRRLLHIYGSSHSSFANKYT